jgi:hypothetical protein
MKEKNKMMLSLQKQGLCPGFPFFFTGIGIVGRI